MRQFSLGELEGRDEVFDEAGEPRRLRGSLRRSLPLVLVIVLPLTMLVLIVSLLLPPTYRATATMVLSDEAVGEAGDSDVVARQLETLERLVTTRPVLTAAAQRLGVTADSLSDKVSASASVQANLVLVTGEDGEAVSAAAIANAVAGSFLELRAAATQRALAASRAALETRIARLQGTGRQGLIASLREALREIAVEEAREGRSSCLRSRLGCPRARTHREFSRTRCSRSSASSSSPS